MNTNQALWEEIFANKEWGKYPSEPLIRFIAKHFYQVPNRKAVEILELGIGGGANMWYMAKEGFSVSGIEWAQNGINQCTKRFATEGLTPFLRDMKCGDYLYVLDNFENKRFDAWIDSASLCCNDMDKTKAIIEKAVQKLKIGGLFFSLTPAEGTFGLSEDKSLGYHLSKPTQGSYANTGLVRFCSEKDIKKLYEGKTYTTHNTYEIQTICDGCVLNRVFIVEGERIK